MKQADLRRLEELKKKGLITEEEYERRKKIMLSFSEKHIYHFEPSHRQEYEKLHEASNANHHAKLHRQVLLHYHKNRTKSKILAGILGIILGSLGFHNFYLAYYGKGIFQLLLSVLSSGMLFPLTAIWGIVEGVLILLGIISEDAHKIELK